MTTGELEALAERLMHGEYTTADLHDAARCARGWAKVMSGLEITRDVTLRGVDEGMGVQWTWWPDDDSPSRAGSPIEAVEAAEVGK